MIQNQQNGGNPGDLPPGMNFMAMSGGVDGGEGIENINEEGGEESNVKSNRGESAPLEKEMILAEGFQQQNNNSHFNGD